MTRLLIAAVGKLRDGPERVLCARYGDRIAQLAKTSGFTFAVSEITESKKQRAADRREDEGSRISALLPPGSAVIVLDAEGTQVDSGGLANRIASWRDRAIDTTAFVIGGADGVSPALMERADLVLSFGKLTWPHQLVRVMLAEQLYRAVTIVIGHPYHRA